MKNIYAMSDIHGDLKGFEDMLKKINFSDEDDLFILGDVIDRGPHGIKIIQKIMASKNMRMLLGNHEHMMLEAYGYPYDDVACYDGDALEIWVDNGGDKTLKEMNKLDIDERTEIVRFLYNLPLEYRIRLKNLKRYALCHAMPIGVYEKLPKRMKGEKGDAYFCVWTRELFDDLDKYRIEGIDGVIFGHTPTANIQGLSKSTGKMRMFDDGYFKLIDCGNAYKNYGGRLSCLNLNTMEVIYG